MSPTDCAYLAGILDGEGSISIARAGASVAGPRFLVVRVIVTSIDRPLIEWLAQRWGGNVFEREFRYPGDNRRPQFRWTAAQVETVLQDALPYLLLKREKAEKALRFLAIKDEYLRRQGGVGYPASLAEERQRIYEWFRDQVPEHRRHHLATIS